MEIAIIIFAILTLIASIVFMFTEVDCYDDKIFVEMGLFLSSVVLAVLCLCNYLLFK